MTTLYPLQFLESLSLFCLNLSSGSISSQIKKSVLDINNIYKQLTHLTITPRFGDKEVQETWHTIGKKAAHPHTNALPSKTEFPEMPSCEERTAQAL